MKRAAAPGQLALTFFEVPEEPAAESGRLDISEASREILAEILSGARAHGRDRYQIAAELSRLGGREMTKNMLDRYCSHGEEWRFPLEALPALTRATGDFRLLELIAAACGCKVLRGEEALLAEIGALLVQERAAHQRLERIRRNVNDQVMERLIEQAAARLAGRETK